jgi:hypothetical protein
VSRKLARSRASTPTGPLCGRFASRNSAAPPDLADKDQDARHQGEQAARGC